MNLQQVAQKYGVNPNSLNAKDDALKIGIKSVQHLVKEMEARKVDKDIIDSLKRLGSFMFDISDSTIG
jgi:thiamine monophosphate synthase